MSDLVPVTAGLFDLSEDGGRLIGGYCASCERFHFPRARTCPYCSAADCAPRALSDRGTLRLFTTVRNRPPGYRGEVPFGFGVVELPEGMQIISRLGEADVARLRIDMPVRLAFDPLHLDEEGRQVVTYSFHPVGEGG
jgi:uncharacterized OB-fold protein